MRAIIITLLLGIGMVIHAQDDFTYDEDYVPEHKTDIGLNLTPLIVSIAPFTNGTIAERYFGHTYKRWGRKVAFRFTLGLAFGELDEIFFDGQEETDFRAYVGLGWERVRRRWGRWQFNTGAEIAVFTGVLDTNASSEDQSAGFAYIPFYEVQFHINDFIYAATSARIAFGLSSQGPILRVIPPLDLMVFVKF